MKVVKGNKIEVGKKTYLCDGCGDIFTWKEGCISYGSLAEEENDPSRLVFCCSPLCSKNAKVLHTIKNKNKPKLRYNKYY